MEKLLKKLIDKAKKRGVTNVQLARIIGVNKSMVTKYFKMDNRIPFARFYLLVIFLYESQSEIDKMVSDFLEVSTKPDCKREAAEVFFNNAKEEFLLDIINKNKADSVLFKLYELFYSRSKRELLPQGFFINLEKIKDEASYSLEEKVLSRIASLCAYCDLWSYNMIPFNAEKALELTKFIESDYIRESFQFRIYESMAYSELKRNQLNKAEEIALLVINSGKENWFPLSVNYMLNLMSEVYVFRDYEKSMDYSKRGFDIFERMNLGKNANRRAMLEATHDFINIYHNKYKNLFLTDPAETVHYLAKTGGEDEKEVALQILMDIKAKKGKLSAFQWYYKALITNDLNDIEESLDEFVANGDKYYSVLPKILLRNKLTV